MLNIFSGKQDVLLDSSNNLFHHELLSFLIYILIETALACLLGWLLIVLCGGKRWFLKLLVGNNVWFKLFSGASLTDMQKSELANILVEVLIETKESTVIYSGLLKNYEVVDNTDELAYITLTGAFRRDLRKAQLTSKELETATIVTASRFDIAYGDIIPIPGHTFTIPGKEIINWNVTYMKRVMDPNTKQPQLEPIKFD
ncbi:MAG TPA: hypothetical protein PL045_06620 [Chitinophagaceae bacterium]|nr:hypothetical protein [Chitinophagaceae bacterium]